MEKLLEAATIKARALAAVKALKNLMAEKTLPEELRKSAEGLQAALRKKWADLEAEVEPKDEAGANLGDALFSGLHSHFVYRMDDLFGNGLVTMSEYQALLEAVDLAVATFRTLAMQNAPEIFARGPWEPPAEQAATETQESAQADSDGEFRNDVIVPLMEGVVRRDGTIPVKIIQPGWGSSGYYAPEVLERDGPKVFTAGMHMYWNHQTPQEEAARPEGNLNDLAAVLASDARWNPSGPKGPGLYADAKVMPHYADKIESLAPHIGLSIRALGKAQTGEAEGKTGALVTELSRGRSVDFVTLAGAGGEILSLFEAARFRADKKSTSETGDVTQNPLEEAGMDLKELQEANATLQTQLDEAKARNARMAEALILREASDLANTALAKVNLPAVTRARLVESLAKAAPVKEGKLDKAAFEAQITEAVKAEVTYLSEAAGLGRIRGMGSSTGTEDEEVDDTASLVEAFQALGLSESSAKVAAAGRD